MQLRRFWLRLALGLLLIFAQQQATLHALSHSVDLLSKQAPAAPQHEACTQCLFFGGLLDAPPPVAIQIATVPASQPLASAPAQFWAPSEPFAHYRSRAPPQLS